MDWGRYLRAVATQNVRSIEKRREAGIADPDKVTADEWKLIQAHDNLLEEEEARSKE